MLFKNNRDNIIGFQTRLRSLFDYDNLSLNKQEELDKKIQDSMDTFRENRVNAENFFYNNIPDNVKQNYITTNK